MPLDNREYAREKHPPNCTCHHCVARRLGIEQGKKTGLCPYCESSNISYNYDSSLEYPWVCDKCIQGFYVPHYVWEYEEKKASRFKSIFDNVIWPESK